MERKRSGRSPSVVMRCAAEASTSDDANVGGGMDRRRVLLGAASLAAASGAGVTVGARSAIAAELSREYRDEEDKYSFKVPGSWEMATGTTSPNPQSTRRVVAFYPPSSPEINGARTCPRRSILFHSLSSTYSPPLTFPPSPDWFYPSRRKNNHDVQMWTASRKYS